MSWWRTGKTCVLQSLGSQRVQHDWAAEQQQKGCCRCFSSFKTFFLLQALPFFWSSCHQTILLLITPMTSPSSCQSLTISNIPLIHCSSSTLVGLPLHLSWWHPQITLSSLIFPSPCFFIFSSLPSHGHVFALANTNHFTTFQTSVLSFPL